MLPLHPRPLPADRPGDHLPAQSKCSSSSSSPSSAGSSRPGSSGRDAVPARPRVRPGGPGDGRSGGPDRRPAHHPQLGRHHRGLRHLPGRRLDPPAGRPRVPRPRRPGARDRLGHHALQRRGRGRQRLLVGDLPGRHRASSWWWWPSTSSATPCATRSRSGCSGAESTAGARRSAGCRRERPAGRRQRHRRLQREVAGGHVPAPKSAERRLTSAQTLLRPRAPGAEPTTRRGVDGGGQLAPHRGLAGGPSRA